MNLRRSILSASIVAALGMSATATAQDAADKSDAKTMETVVVKGIRGSLKQSLETKRDADAIVDAISAEDIGKFPDKNVAESLSHLPGITVDRDFGQGERVSIRGTDPALNRTLLNGQTIASADWFILDSPGRTFNYTLLSPEIVGKLEVYKSPEARIDEGSIGGTVILHTRRPLELESNTLQGTLEYSYNDRADEGNPNASGLFSWKNDADTVGLIVSAIHSEEELRRDGIETFSYPTASGFPAGVIGSNTNAVFPNAINAALFQQERTRNGATFGFQAKPTDNFELNVTGLYVDAEYDNFNQSRYVFNGFSASSATSATVNDGIVTGATFGPDALTLLDAIVRKAEVETKALDIKGDWTGDGWTASAQAGTTKADGGTKQQYFLEFEGRGGYSYDISGAPDHPASVTFVNDPTNPASMPGLGFAQLRQQPTSDEEQYLQGDFAKELQWGIVNQLLVGVKFRQHETTQDARLTGVGGLAGRSLSDFSLGLTPGDFLSGMGVNDGLSDWATVNRALLERFLRGVPENGSYNEFPEAQFNVQEDITAAYAQLNFGGDNFHGNFGVRYVGTDQTSKGSTRTGTGIIANKSEKDYDDFLPSFNLAYDINEDLVLRFAGSRVIARPNYADLSSFTVLLETVRSGNGGNPDLDPYRANDFDLSAEWYMGDDGLLSVTAFHKNISSYIVPVSAQEQQFNVLTNQIETFDITRPRNGNGGKTRGFELSYQNVIYGGFGIQANYTYAKGTTEDGNGIPFNSRDSVNITPYYEDGPFSARLTYGYRSKYFREIGRNGVAVTNDNYTEVDASIGYRISDNIEITAQALNLLDDTQYQYAGTTDKPLAAYRNGRRYFLGVRFGF